jgi:hypothetical protein
MFYQEMIKTVENRVKPRLPGSGCGNGTDYTADCLDPNDVQAKAALGIK